MRVFEDLLDLNDPAMPLVKQWLAKSSRPYEVLAPSERRREVLLDLQVTTRSPMGAIAYETGGILVDYGWMRFIGSGHPRLPRNIVEWNAGRSLGYLLVADDVVGGFFAINGGGLGSDHGLMYYWAPDTLKWEPLGLGYTDFFSWSLSERLSVFYESLRWFGWETDIQKVGGDQCFNFYPPLWTEQGSVESSSRKAINVAEQYSFNTEVSAQVPDA
jgi:hypothetical protein